MIGFVLAAMDLVGSFTPEMREVDDDVMRKSRIFIDTEDALAESGDIATPIAEGVISTVGVRSSHLRDTSLTR